VVNPTAVVPVVQESGMDVARGRTRTSTGGAPAPLVERPGQRSDADLLAALADPVRVPREADGTVPVRRAAAALGTGPDRARRLLNQAGLLRTEPFTDRTNGIPVPALTATTSEQGGKP
jgi:hypothetical protein